MDLGGNKQRLEKTKVGKGDSTSLKRFRKQVSQIHFWGLVWILIQTNQPKNTPERKPGKTEHTLGVR